MALTFTFRRVNRIGVAFLIMEPSDLLGFFVREKMDIESEWKERCDALGINDIQLALLLDTNVCNCRRWKKGRPIRREYHRCLAGWFLSGKMDRLAQCIQTLSQQTSDWQAQGRRLIRVWHRFYFSASCRECNEKVFRLCQAMLSVYAEKLCQE